MANEGTPYSPDLQNLYFTFACYIYLFPHSISPLSLSHSIYLSIYAC